VSASFQDDWVKLNEIVEGRSEFGRESLAVAKANELSWKIVTTHHIGLSIPQRKLTWLAGKRVAEKAEKAAEREL
jgi:hypothetical protein